MSSTTTANVFTSKNKKDVKDDDDPEVNEFNAVTTKESNVVATSSARANTDSIFRSTSSPSSRKRKSFQLSTTSTEAGATATDTKSLSSDENDNHKEVGAQENHESKSDNIESLTETVASAEVIDNDKNGDDNNVRNTSVEAATDSSVGSDKPMCTYDSTCATSNRNNSSNLNRNRIRNEDRGDAQNHQHNRRQQQQKQEPEQEQEQEQNKMLSSSSSSSSSSPSSSPEDVNGAASGSSSSDDADAADDHISKKRQQEYKTSDASWSTKSACSTTPERIVGVVEQQQNQQQMQHMSRRQHQQQQDHIIPPHLQQEQPQQIQLHSQPHPQKQKQPEGWRVKLYRLNVDGSWDDCGTGRIVCLYFSPNKNSASKNANFSESNIKNIANAEVDIDNNTTPNSSDGSKSIDQWLYQETGEATLCVHAEVLTTTSSSTTSSSTAPSNHAENSKEDAITSENVKDHSKKNDEPLQVLLQTRILLRDAYQRQGDNIITWCEPYYPSQKNHDNGKSPTTSNHNDRNSNGVGVGVGVDLALSFQDNAGCLDIWRQITHVQGRAASLLRQHQQQQLHLQQQRQRQRHHQRLAGAGVGTAAIAQSHTTSIEDMAAQAAAQHHATLQNEHQQQQTEQWNKHQKHHHQPHSRRSHHSQNEQFDPDQSYGSESVSNRYGLSENDDEPNVGNDMDSIIESLNENERQQRQILLAQQQQHHHQQQQQQQLQEHQQQQQWQLPSCPTLQNLEEISNVFASVQHVSQHLETLITWMIADDCLYLKQLLQLFPPAEERGDYGKLATLAACVKFVLLLNDPSILEWIVDDPYIFEQVCSCFEYDPDLREKANHRWFLRDRAKFRTVVPMEDPALVMLIHRSFRVTYLRDTLLRPTMDESSLSTLTSLQTFTNIDVIKGVAMLSGAVSPNSTASNTANNNNNNNKDSSQQQQQLVNSENDNDNDNNISLDQDVSDALKGSYLARVMHVLGVEIHALTIMAWSTREVNTMASSTTSPSSIAHSPKITSLYTSEVLPQQNVTKSDADHHEDTAVSDPSIVMNNPEATSKDATTWGQYLAPQDGSVESRRIRRRGCLCFLRELFNMARTSLPQREKDDFLSAICRLEIDLLPSLHEQSNSSDDGVEFVGGGGGAIATDEYFRGEGSDTVSQTSQTVEVGSVASTVRSADFRMELNEKVPSLPIPTNSSTAVGSLPCCTSLLSILGNILADPTTDSVEMNAALEIIAGIAMHDPSLIRQHCIDCHRAWKRDKSDQFTGRDPNIVNILCRPEPNENKEVIFLSPPDDLLLALLYLFVVEADAGVLLQASEIMRIVLDTGMVGDYCGPMSPTAGPVGIYPDNPLDEGYPSEKQINSLHEHHTNMHTTSQHATEQKQFLSMFYENYVEWLVAPFQFKIFYPSCRIPRNVLLNPSESPAMQKYLAAFQKGTISWNDPFLQTVSESAIRSSFTIELLSFFVRAHVYWMKNFLLKTRVLVRVLNILRVKPDIQPDIHGPGDRCLKLAALRFLRSVLSVKDELYHRQIIQNNLFGPVFETFRANPVGDNLLSSAIVEICDFIHSEKIKSLMDYVVTKHLLVSEGKTPSIEEVSSPYVTTFVTLRKGYEANLASQGRSQQQIKVDNKKGNHDDKSRNKSHSSSSGTSTNTSSSSNTGSKSNHCSLQYKDDVGNDVDDDNLNDDSITSEINNAVITTHLQHQQRQLSGKALEDQRKFREVDEEESYFDSDDDDNTRTSYSLRETVVTEHDRHDRSL